MPLLLADPLILDPQAPFLSDAVGRIFPMARDVAVDDAVSLSVADGHLCWRGAPLLPLADGTDLPPLVESLLTHALGQAPGWLGLHAAALRWRERDWIFPGDRGSGKSSLALALLARGADYGTDELVRARLDGATEWFALPKAPTVKADHSPFALPGESVFIDPFRGPLQYPLPSRWRGEEALREPLLVFPVFSAGAKAEAWRLSPGLALMALGQQVFGGLRHRPQAFDRLAVLAERPAWRIRYGSSDAALDLLARIREGENFPLARSVTGADGDTLRETHTRRSGKAAALRALWRFAAPRLHADPGPCAPASWPADRWLALVEAHQVEGLLTDLPGGARAGGEARLRAAARRAITRWEALRALLADLEPLRESLCLLKGPSWLGTAYAYAAAREWTDVDLLAASPADADRAWRHLIDRGYQEGRAFENHHHLPPLRHPATGGVVEIHHDLSVPPLGEKAIAWFGSHRRDWRFGDLSFPALDPAGLRAHVALHALNNPVDGALLRDLLEFAACETGETEAFGHPRAAAAADHCRRMISKLKGDPVEMEPVDRLLWRALLSPPGCRNHWEELRARVDRRRIEPWHARGGLPAAWPIWCLELGQALRHRRTGKAERAAGGDEWIWTHGRDRVGLDLASGAMRLDAGG